MTENLPVAYANVDVIPIKEQWAQATKDVLANQPPPRELPPEIVEDFNMAHDNIQEISKIGMEAISSLGILCEQAQNDKFYAALASLVRAANETQRDLLELHKKKKELLGQEPPRTINNTLVMTSAEMLKQIRGEK